MASLQEPRRVLILFDCIDNADIDIVVGLRIIVHFELTIYSFRICLVGTNVNFANWFG